MRPLGITAAQDAKFPSRAVTLVVPFPPGGSADALPRIVAEKLRERWGQPVVIENRPGAAGSTGSGSVFRAPADGYTLLSTPAGPLAINGLVQKTLPYTPAAFVPVSLLALSPTVLTVRLNFPANTAEEFIHYAKANPGKLNYASQGPGSTSHLTGVMFTQRPAARWCTCLIAEPARRSPISSPAMSICSSTTSARRCRCIVPASQKSSPSPHPNDRNWCRRFRRCARRACEIFSRAHGSRWSRHPARRSAIAEQINRTVNEVLALPEIQAQFEALGVQPRMVTPQELAAFVAGEAKRWTDVARDAKIEKE